MVGTGDWTLIMIFYVGEIDIPGYLIYACLLQDRPDINYRIDQNGRAQLYHSGIFRADADIGQLAKQTSEWPGLIGRI